MSEKERLTHEEMMERIRAELEHAWHTDPAVEEQIICDLVGEWVLKGWEPPLFSILHLLQDHGLAQ